MYSVTRGMNELPQGIAVNVHKEGSGERELLSSVAYGVERPFHLRHSLYFI